MTAALVAEAAGLEAELQTAVELEAELLTAVQVGC